MFLLNGNPLPLDTPFTIDGTSYPANWLRLTSIEEKNAVGITEVADVTTTYDDRFYWSADNPKQIRKVERSVDIPADTVTYRAAVIAECTRLVTAIQGCADVPALIAVVTAQGWPVNE